MADAAIKPLSIVQLLPLGSLDEMGKLGRKPAAIHNLRKFLDKVIIAYANSDAAFTTESFREFLIHYVEDTDWEAEGLDLADVFNALKLHLDVNQTFFFHYLFGCVMQYILSSDIVKDVDGAFNRTPNNAQRVPA